ADPAACPGGAAGAGDRRLRAAPGPGLRDGVHRRRDRAARRCRSQAHRRRDREMAAGPSRGAGRVPGRPRGLRRGGQPGAAGRGAGRRPLASVARPRRGRPEGGRGALRLPGPGRPVQAGKRAETTLQRWQQVHDLLGKGVGLLDCARRLNLTLNTVKRYARADRPERLQRAPQYRPTLVGPYLGHLRKRRAEDPAVPAQQLLREIRELGYQGSPGLLVRYINQGRAEGDRPHLSRRQAARILLTRPDGLAAGQQETLAGVEAACPEMAALAVLIRSFAALLAPARATTPGSGGRSPARAPPTC